MSIKFFDVFNKGDWIKMTILLVVSAICWTLVWHEYQKPIIPPGWDQEISWQETTID